MIVSNLSTGADIVCGEGEWEELALAWCDMKESLGLREVEVYDQTGITKT